MGNPSIYKGRKKIKLSHFIFIVPAIVLNLVFFFYPLIQSLIMSFYNWPVLGAKTFIGLQNYINLMQDDTFWHSLWFTAKYTILVTPAIFFVAFALALLINSKLPGIGLFRSIYFVPVVISMVACSLMWMWVYNDLYGVLNYYLVQFHIIDESINWLGQASTSLPAITFMIAWKMAGFTMIILLAGLQSIPEEVYEASKIDGATKFQQILYITTPLLRPSIALSLVVSVIGSVLAFEQFLIMTKGGPAQATTTAVHLIYNTSFKYYQLGYGAAMTIVLLIILVILSMLQFKLLKDPVN
ncbi:sugar ABC transporter permease [Radiobacillus deserti]|uniref:Sugar ABC transporter permease n=2 Tax=Radiobacillus deserti TaxID=2594883 RepID=A0A516KL23_9BACI|nr:sugar ABC transporter permease [Radiobacillus deserti]